MQPPRGLHVSGSCFAGPPGTAAMSLTTHWGEPAQFPAIAAVQCFHLAPVRSGSTVPSSGARRMGGRARTTSEAMSGRIRFFSTVFAPTGRSRIPRSSGSSLSESAMPSIPTTELYPPTVGEVRTGRRGRKRAPAKLRLPLPARAAPPCHSTIAAGSLVSQIALFRGHLNPNQRNNNIMGKTIKWILIAIALAFVGNVVKESLKASKEVDARIKFEDSCSRQARAGNTVPAQAVGALCSCTSEKAIKSLGHGKFAKVLASGNEAAESDKSVLSSALMSCFEEHRAK